MDNDCRAKCSGCLGSGCRQCDHLGYVCPICLGMRFLRRDVPVGHKDFGALFRCEACCEGNNVSADKQYRVVTHYLRNFIAARLAQPV